MFRVVVHQNQQKYVWECATLERAIHAALDTRRSEGLWVEAVTDESDRIVVSRTELDARYWDSRERLRESA
jgi:hypothetical protein